MAGQPLVDLVSEVNETVGVIDSAVALINGFAARLATAVADALANGATPDELAPLTALKDQLAAEKAALAAAVAANA